MLQRAEAQHAEALATISAVKDTALKELAATEVAFRQAMQARGALPLRDCSESCSASGSELQLLFVPQYLSRICIVNYLI